MTHFSSLQIKKWRQFSEIDFDLSRNVTVITGPNGTGKTSLLTILSSHFGWNLKFVSTPFISKRKAQKVWSDFQSRFDFENEDINNLTETMQIGSIAYSNGNLCQISTPATSRSQYQLTYSNKSEIRGLHIPSHRPAATYYAVQDIPINPKSVQVLYQEFLNVYQQTQTGARVTTNPGSIQKQSLISLALFGYGNEAVQANSEYRNTFEGFQEVLSKVLPDELGFLRLEIRMPDVVLVTNSGTFSLDAMSGGISSMFGIAWQIFMYGEQSDGCTVTIDEPENHLHPQMQRSVLPALAEAFPQYRFIIATHSPFVVTSFRDAEVYALTYDDNQRVTSVSMDADELISSPNRVLREVLDVPSTLPIWLEKEIQSVLTDTESLEPKERAKFIWERLRSFGVTDALPDLKID